MIRQSIVRGIVGVQKRRAKSACDATAMLRFFRARRGAVRCGAVRCGAVRCGAVRCGATTGCALFPASVLCFPAVDPLHRQSTHVHAHIQTRTPLHPVDRPAALLSPVERIRRRAFFEYSMPPPPSFSLSLFLSFAFALFRSLSLWFRHDGIDRLSI